MLRSCIKNNLLLSEQQMPWEEAVSSHGVATLVGQQPNPVSPDKLNVHVATGCNETILPGGVWVHNRPSVKLQVHVGIILVDCTVEVKLINTWDITDKNTCIDIITVLSIVDDIVEDEWSAISGRTRA